MNTKARTESGTGPSADAAPDSLPDTRPFLEVAAGIVHRPVSGAPGRWEVLMGQRPQGKAYAGWWEFPGGKIEAGESVAQALARELQEELDLQVLTTLPWVVREHSYPHARVRLHFQRIFDWRGEPRSMEAQAFAWQSLDRIDLSPLLPAALPLLEMLRWPARLGLHGFDGVAPGPAGLEAVLKCARDKGLDRLLLKLDVAPGAGPAAQLNVLLACEAAQGLQVYLDEANFNRLTHEGSGACTEGPCAGFWRSGHLAGTEVLEVWARGGLFSEASLSAADDLRLSEQASGSSLSLQACVVAGSGPASRQDFSLLAAQARAPLYWRDAGLLTLGGHGLALAV